MKDYVIILDRHVDVLQLDAELRAENIPLVGVSYSTDGRLVVHYEETELTDTEDIIARIERVVGSHQPVSDGRGDPEVVTLESLRASIQELSERLAALEARVKPIGDIQ